MFDITKLMELVFAIISVVITTFVIPFIRSKTTNEQQKQIEAWVRIAVSAAEQIFPEKGSGKAKKQYVIQWLTEHNLTVDENKLDALIESAVHTLKNPEISTTSVNVITTPDTAPIIEEN